TVLTNRTFHLEFNYFYRLTNVLIRQNTYNITLYRYYSTLLIILNHFTVARKLHTKLQASLSMFVVFLKNLVRIENRVGKIDSHNITKFYLFIIYINVIIINAFYLSFHLMKFRICKIINYNI